MGDGKKGKRSYEKDEPVSLAPLDFRTALAALMGRKPEPQDEAENAPQSEDEVRGGGEDAPEQGRGK